MGVTRRRLPAQTDGVVLLVADGDGHSLRRGTGHCGGRKTLSVPSHKGIVVQKHKRRDDTSLGHPEVTRVALPPVQAAAVRPNFELVLVASPQGARLSLETGQRDLFGRPVRGGGQEGAVQNLEAIQVMRLRREGLELRGAEGTQATGDTPDTHRVDWVRAVQPGRTFHWTWDVLDPGAVMETLSKETRRADSSLWRSFCSVLAGSGQKGKKRI